MKTYMVGGAVRDRLLGLPVNDHDWVVVGSTPEAMLAQGFVPVGKDFPVFLHPRTHEEYALARTERKSGRGYRGFSIATSPDVTLEQDLARRDLTINAMAAPVGWNGSDPVTDPYGGQADLAARVLRHVTDAFREDPVRILRLARFAAEYYQRPLGEVMLPTLPPPLRKPTSYQGKRSGEGPVARMDARKREWGEADTKLSLYGGIYPCFPYGIRKPARRGPENL